MRSPAAFFGRCLAALAVAGGALLLGAVAARAQGEAGHPFVQAFGIRDYEGHNQTWAAVQDRRGVLYVGNKDAVLTYDGFAWGKIPTGGLFVRGLACDAQDRIWIGAVDQLGYLEDDGRGGRNFVSVRAQLPPGEESCGPIFQVFAFTHGVYFIGEDRLLRWHEGKITVEHTGRLFGHAVGDELAIHVRGQALTATSGHGWRTVVDDPVLRANWMTFVAAQPDGSWLLVSQNAGCWRLASGALQRFPTAIDAVWSTHSVARGRQLADGTLALLLRPGGLAVLDPRGGLRQWLDDASGLPIPILFGLMQDRHGDLWTSLNSGLARLTWPPALTKFDETNGLGRGTVGAIVRHRGQLHVGTNEGVFRLEPGGWDGARPFPARFRPVPGFTQWIWGLASMGDTLLVAGAGGGRALEPNGETTVVAAVDFSTCVLVLRGDTDRAVFGTRDGIYLTRRESGRWSAAERVPGLQGEVRALAESRDGSVWVAVSGRGFQRVLGLPGTTSADGATPRVENYSSGHGLTSTRPHDLPALAAWRGEVAFLDDPQVCTFDVGQKRFVPLASPAGHVGSDAFTVPTLGAGLGETLWLRTLRSDAEAGPRQGRQLWRFTPGGAWEPLPFAAADAYGENAVFFEEPSAGGSTLWLGGSEGLLRAELPAALLQPAPFQTTIRRVGPDTTHPLALAAAAVLPFRERTLNFSFATDRLDGRHLRFQTRLDDNAWSELSAGTSLVVPAPDAGRHTLVVRARDADGRVGAPATFAFTVLPPWWQTWWALGFYALGAAGSVTGLVRWRVGAIRRRNLQLERIVAERTAALRDNERQLVIARDAADAANRAKSVFLASMSHDLRTPLNAILGYAQLLRHSPGLGAESRRQIETVHASGDHLLQMINDVLDLAKIEAGKVELHVQPVSLSRLLAHLTEIFEPRAAQKKIAFALHGETPLPDLVLADEGRLRQVLYNLLGNAIKFTERGRVELRVGCVSGTGFPARDSAIHEKPHGLESPCHAIRFTVVDTGIGIAPAEQAAIFGLFHQAAGPALSAQGTGLGLAISQRLVRLMGGEIAVESPSASLRAGPSISLSAGPGAPGPGSRFTFAIDLPEAPVAAPAAVIETLPPGYRGPRRRVLVVDDEPVNRDLLRALLEPRGFVLEETDNGAAAVALVAAQPPDLVLMDLRLKQVDGLTATRRIRALPGAAGVRIVAISASVFPVDRSQAIEAGCDEFEPKPIRAAALLATIGRLLGLEWESADAPAAIRSPLPPAQLPGNWALPPLSVLNELDAHADLGDMAALRSALALARRAHREAAPFLDTLESFAAAAQLAALRDWIARALQTRTAHHE